MKRVIISESTYNRLFESRINESIHYSDKVLKIKQFLDKNFQRANLEANGDNGLSKFIPIVIQLDYNGQPTKRTISDKDLFYIVQYNFKSIMPAKERDNFLKRVIKDWYQKKITKQGSLSRYDF